MFDFFKVLFGGSPKIPEETDEELVQEPEQEQKEPVKEPVKEPQKVPIKKPKVPVVVPTPQKNIKKVVKEVIIEEQKELDMVAEIFLVVIDTNGRPECSNFSPGIQNFYFIHALDETQATTIVLETFKQRPALRAQLQYATRATRLSSIVRSVGPGHNFWTYVPIGRQRSPGQQGIPPKPEQLLRPDEFGNPSSTRYAPQAPIGGEQVSEDELKSVQFNGADGKIINKLRATGQPIPPLNEELPPVSPEVAALTEQMSQMKEMMAQMIQANQKPARSVKKKAPEVTPEPPVDGEATQ